LSLGIAYCSIFAVLLQSLQFLLQSFTEPEGLEVMKWLESKRSPKRLGYLPPPFLAHFEGYIMSINKLATRLLLPQRS
jgi:hypothetical protein